MPVLTTQTAAHIKEDLDSTIYKLEPTETPFITSIGKTKASSRTFEWLISELDAPSDTNFSAEGADAADSTLTTPTRINNQTQIFTKTVQVSGTLEAVETVGAKTESARQIVDKFIALKTDMEKTFLSQKPSDSGSTRKSAGASAFIATNALHGANGATTGWSSGAVGAVTNGTNRAFTEDLLKTGLQKAWDEGGSPSKIILGGAMKVKLSTFSGGNTKQQNAKDATIYANVDVYRGDFQTLDVVPSRHISPTTVICYDPKMWAVATLRAFQKNELAKTGDSVKYQLLCEATLQSKNEKANAKIADVNS